MNLFIFQFIFCEKKMNCFPQRWLTLNACFCLKFFNLFQPCEKLWLQLWLQLTTLVSLQVVLSNAIFILPGTTDPVLFFIFSRVADIQYAL